MMKMKMKMCVQFVILALVSQHASGVQVYEGEESVLLPCQFAAPIPEGYVIVWRRDDLRSPIVHSIVDGKEDLSSQNHRYTNRTSMRGDALQSGHLSLTLRKPTFTDSGTYTCTTRSRGVDKERTEVLLQVTERPLWPKILPAVLVPVILLGAVIVFLLYRVKKRQKSITVGQLITVEAMEGDESVQLTYKPSLPLPKGFKVEWVFVTDENKKVCVFENGQIKQHEDYRGRAEMKMEWLKEKKETDRLNECEVDLSLTLENPECKHGGVYLCFIYDKDGNTLRLKVVTLLVTARLRTAIKASLKRNQGADPKHYRTTSLEPQEPRPSGPPKLENSDVYENVGETRPLNA